MVILSVDCNYKTFLLLFLSNPRKYFQFPLATASIYKYDPELIPMLRPDGRIVGGRSTTIYEFPFQVSYNNYGAHRGGGVIITPKTILTGIISFHKLDW